MYRKGRSIQVPVATIDLVWLNASKLSFEWYLPMPELPTPPKGTF